MSDLKTNDEKAFRETFCQRCRQPNCDLAQWSGDLFTQRTSTQADRLLRPTQADPTSSRYEGLKDFQDMLQQAMTLEIADRRGDWNVPSVPDFSKPQQQLPKHMVYAMPQDKSLVVVDDGQTDPVEELVAEVVTERPARPALPQGEPATVVPTVKAASVPTHAGNTPMPLGGIVLGGPAPTAPVAPKHDPWAAPTTPAGNVVKRGATIKMGK